MPLHGSMHIVTSEHPLSLQEHALFHGSISSEIEGGEEASKRMQRSGFAGFNTEVRIREMSTNADVQGSMPSQAEADEGQLGCLRWGLRLLNPK